MTGLREAPLDSSLQDTSLSDLRRGLRDLANLMALDHVWLDRNPEYVAQSLAELLGRTVAAEACLVHLQLDGTAQPIRATWPADAPEIAEALAAVTLSGQRVAGPPERGQLQTVTIDLQLLGLTGRVVAAAARPTFPSPIEALLIRTAANQAAFSIRNGHLLSDERRERARFQELFTQAPALIVVLTGPDHRFEFANERFVQTVGLSSREQLIGRTVRDVFPGGYGEAQARRLDRVYREGKPLSFVEEPFTLRPPSGPPVERFFSYVLQPFHDSLGKLEGILGHSVDVTDQVLGRRAADAEAERTRRLQRATAALAAPMAYKQAMRAVVAECRAALEASGGWLILGDSERTMRIVQVLGFDAHTRARLRDLVASGNVPAAIAFREAIPVYLPSEASAHAVPALPPLWQELGIAAAASVPLISGQLRLGALTLTFDTPRIFDRGDRALLDALATQCAQAIERVQAQEIERQSREARDAFVGLISHELRTPITTVLGGTRLLLREGLDAERRKELLEDMSAESERLSRLVEDLLVLSKVEHRRLETASEPVQLSHLIDAVMASERRRWPGVTFERRPSPGLPPVVGEETYVEQVLRNLFSNAAKYGGPGSVVGVWMQLVGDRIRVNVQDNGPGLDPGEVSRIFDLFYRSPSTARARSGAGIGLFVCRALVQAMGGRIWATRRQPHGTRFTFDLEVYADEDTD